ncbi:flavodoxin domain-containing protein [Embleya sp. NPDC005575]|uniref:flavodoxin domain-containing protein n=1 Tax=Embleya sp. NPDC005575 TaxID=3156892 RepID=UPI0033B1F01F
MNVLITYASAHSGTRAIAHLIGERPRSRGLHARVGPMNEGEDLSRFDAYILGSAIHGGSRPPTTATTFADEHRAEFADRPVRLFDVDLARALVAVAATPGGTT